MPKLVHSHVLRYGLAVVSVTASMLLRIPLAEKLGSSVPFLFFFPALMVSGWYGGLGPGLLATLLSAAAAFYFILEPGYSFALTNAGDTFTLVLFIIVGVSMSLFSSQWQKAKESLRQSEERFAKAFQASPLALTITSLRTGRLLEVNETFTRLSGYTREEAIGHTTLELGLWSRPSDRDEELAIVSKRGQVRSMEYRFRMRDGRELVGLLSAEQIEIDGELCALTVIEDITEKTRVQAEREQLLASEQEARRQAEVANRMKDEFLATVSHELRTPLNAIMGWAGVLRRTNLNESDLSRAIRVIERNARSQSQLIDDLLDVSRIITGKLRIDLHPVDLTSVVEAAIDVIKPSAEVKAVRLQVVLDPRPGLISGDPARLQQVVWNLLSNAVKFTPRGGRVQVKLERVNSSAEITVSDTGQGISPDFLPSVFDRFCQGDSSYTRRHGGLGLGLAIVRHLVELHGGTVEVYSPGEGQGATFKVRFPLIVAHAAGQLQPQTQSSEQPGRTGELLLERPPALDELQVVLVEDEPDAREMVKVLLEKCGAKVRAVASAAEALEAIRSCKPDVLVIDIEMPCEDGYALIRKVRSLDSDQGGLIPAVALTAHARSEDRLKALSAGYQAHVAKPVSVDGLLLVMASITGRVGRRPAR